MLRLQYTQFFFFFEKTDDDLLKSASCASNFCWIWLILKHPYNRLLFSFGLVHMNTLFITFHNVIDVFRSTAIVLLEHFLRQIDHLLGSVSNFCWIWVNFKHPYSRLLFTFGLVRVNARFITYHDIIDVFRSTAIAISNHCFQPIDHLLGSTSNFCWIWLIL